MLITRRSPITGRVRSMDLPVTQEQLDSWANRRGMIQDIFPHLTADQREFIMTGVSAEEWDALTKEDDL